MSGAVLEGELIPAGALRRAERGLVPTVAHLRIEVGDTGMLLHALDVPSGHVLAAMMPLDEPGFSALVYVGGVAVPRAYWHRVRTKPGARVVVRIVMQGGDKGLFRQIAFLALAVGATILTGGAAVPLLGGAFAAGTFGAAALGVTASLVGGMAINALLPPPKQPAPSYTQGREVASISSGSNQLRRYGRKRLVFGEHLVTPDLGGSYVTEIVGDEQYLRMYLIVCNGPAAIDRITFETTPIESYEGVEAEVREGWPDDAPLTLYTRKVSEEQLGVLFENDGEDAVRSSQPATVSTVLEFVAQSGVTEIQTDGTGYNQVRVLFDVYVRDSDGGSYRRVTDFEPIGRVFAGGMQTTRGTVDGSFYVRGDDDTQLLRFGIRVNHRAAQQDWRVVRRGTYAERNGGHVEIDPTDEGKSAKINWTILRSFADESEPLSRSTVPQAVIALRVKASNELSNTVPTVRCRARKYIQVPSGSGWQWSLSANPAWCYRYAHTSEAVTPRTVGGEMMDDDTLADWADDCRLLGLEFNALVREDTHQALVNQIASIGRARPGKQGDKFSVVRDLPQQGSVQLFDDRNSWDHSIDASLTRMPHALRVKYDDPQNGGENEVVVYRDGFDDRSATEFEVFDVTYGVTDPAQAHKAGRYWFADRILRPENGSLTTDMRSILCEAGSLIDVQMTIALIGQASARTIQVITDDDGLATVIVLDAEMVIEPDTEYGVRIQRASDAETITRGVANTPGITNRIELSTPTPGLGVEDNVAFGEADKITIPAIVRTIRRADGVRLNGTIEWVPAAPEIHDIEDGPIPDYDPRVSDPIALATLPPAPVRVDQVVSDESVLRRATDNSILPSIVVRYQQQSSDAPSVGVVVVRYRRAGRTEWISARDAPPSGAVRLEAVEQGQRYEMQIRTVSIYGGMTTFERLADHVVVGKSTPPPNVAGLRARREISSVLIDWYPPSAIDVNDTRIEIRTDESDWEFIGYVDGTQLRTDVKPVAQYEVRAKHRDSNVRPLMSRDWAVAELQVPRPPAPVVDYTFDGPDLVLKWIAETGPWPLENFRVYRDGQIIDSPKTTQWRTRVNYRDGDYRQGVEYAVAQVDAAGNESEMARTTVQVSVARLEAQAAQVFVNRALLAWRIISGSLPVERTRILAGPSFATATERATSDTNATFVEETEAGEYTYWLVAEDSAGYDTAPQRQVVRLSAPAGFILRNRFSSRLDGNREGLLPAIGPRLIGPVNMQETIAEHFDSRGWGSPADQIAAGYPFVLQPTRADALLTEIYDCKAIVPASGIAVALKTTVYAAEADDAAASVRISVRRAIGDSWTVFGDDQRQVYASDFRYVRVQVIVDAPNEHALLSIDAIDTQISTQEQRETGKTRIDSNPTRVTLQKSFVDITHVSAQPIGAGPNVRVIAINDYDVAYPKHIDFEAYDLTDGSAWNGSFSYAIDGT